MLKRGFLIAAGLATVSSGLYLYYTNRKKNEEKEEKKEKEEKLKEKEKKKKISIDLLPTDDWVKYKNEKLGFQIKHPPGWFTLAKPQLQTPTMTVNFIDPRNTLDGKKQTFIVIEDQKGMINLEKYLVDSLEYLQNSMEIIPTIIHEKKHRVINGKKAFQMKYTMSHNLDGKQKESLTTINIGIAVENRIYLFQHISQNNNSNNSNNNSDERFVESIIRTWKVFPSKSSGKLSFQKGEVQIIFPSIYYEILSSNKPTTVFRVATKISHEIKNEMLLSYCKKEMSDDQYEDSIECVGEVEKRIIQIIGEKCPLYIYKDKNGFHCLSTRFESKNQKYVLFAKTKNIFQKDDIILSFESIKFFPKKKKDVFLYRNYEHKFSIQYPTNHSISQHCHNNPIITINDCEGDDVYETCVAISELGEKTKTIKKLQSFSLLEIKSSQDIELIDEKILKINGKEAVRIYYRQISPQGEEHSICFFLTLFLLNENEVCTIRSYGLGKELHEQKLSTFKKIHSSFVLFKN